MSSSKVKEINLERGMPAVAPAMTRLVNDLTTAKMSGCKAAVIVHGWGSSGTGGAIKAATAKKLKEPQLRGIIRDTVSGEKWMEKKKDFINICPQLKEFSRYVDGNKGITVAVLK